MMHTLLALTAREVKAFWYSPIFYAVGALFLVMQGWVFWLFVAVLNDQGSAPSWTMTEVFFGPSFYYALSLLIVAPLLSMRAFSEEKRTGSIELLLTAPVTDMQVVLSKFFGAWLIYILLWASTITFFLWFRLLTPFSWGSVFTGYLGTWLLGGVLVAVGVFTSSLTRNQVIAAVFSFLLLLVLFSVGFLGYFVQDPDAAALIRYLSVLEHLRDFSKGFVDTRPFILYLSLTAVFLFLTGRVIGNPRWRS